MEIRFLGTALGESDLTANTFSPLSHLTGPLGLLFLKGKGQGKYASISMQNQKRQETTQRRFPQSTSNGEVKAAVRHQVSVLQDKF